MDDSLNLTKLANLYAVEGLKANHDALLIFAILT